MPCAAVVAAAAALQAAQRAGCAGRSRADEKPAWRPLRLRLERLAAQPSHAGAGGDSLPGAGSWQPDVAGGAARDAHG